MTPDDIREQRDRLLAQIESMGDLPASFTTPVVGVSFAPTYPDNLRRLEEMQLMSSMTTDEPLPCVLVREPANQYDPNAVEVHVPSLGASALIGHLTRPIAARVAREMDAGTIWTAHVVCVRVDPDHPDRPGVDIHLARKAA